MTTLPALVGTPAQLAFAAKKNLDARRAMFAASVVPAVAKLVNEMVAEAPEFAAPAAEMMAKVEGLTASQTTAGFWLDIADKGAVPVIAKPGTDEFSSRRAAQDQQASINGAAENIASAMVPLLMGEYLPTGSLARMLAKVLA